MIYDLASMGGESLLLVSVGYMAAKRRGRVRRTQTDTERPPETNLEHLIGEWLSEDQTIMDLSPLDRTVEFLLAVDAMPAEECFKPYQKSRFPKTEAALRSLDDSPKLTALAATICTMTPRSGYGWVIDPQSVHVSRQDVVTGRYYSISWGEKRANGYYKETRSFAATIDPRLPLEEQLKVARTVSSEYEGAPPSLQAQLSELTPGVASAEMARQLRELEIKVAELHAVPSMMISSVDDPWYGVCGFCRKKNGRHETWCSTRLGKY